LRVFTSPEDLLQSRGELIGFSEWVEVDQTRIELFADATNDHNWVHLDAERAAASRYGGTIAHGFLTLALLADFSVSLFRVDGHPLAINYGLNKVRFPAPVPSGSKVRARADLQEATVVAGGVQITTLYTFECTEGDKPVCVAEHVSMRLAE
jgi:acyl dehydratase